MCLKVRSCLTVHIFNLDYRNFFVQTKYAYETVKVELLILKNKYKQSPKMGYSINLRMLKPKRVIKETGLN